MGLRRTEGKEGSGDMRYRQMTAKEIFYKLGQRGSCILFKS